MPPAPWKPPPPWVKKQVDKPPAGERGGRQDKGAERLRPARPPPSLAKAFKDLDAEEAEPSGSAECDAKKNEMEDDEDDGEKEQKMARIRDLLREVGEEEQASLIDAKLAKAVPRKTEQPTAKQRKVYMQAAQFEAQCAQRLQTATKEVEQPEEFLTQAKDALQIRDTEHQKASRLRKHYFDMLQEEEGVADVRTTDGALEPLPPLAKVRELLQVVKLDPAELAAQAEKDHARACEQLADVEGEDEVMSEAGSPYYFATMRALQAMMLAIRQKDTAESASTRTAMRARAPRTAARSSSARRRSRSAGRARDEGRAE